MPNFERSCVGDTCFHLKWGACKISDLGFEYIWIKHHSGRIMQIIRKDGRENVLDDFPLLYHSRPTIDDPPPPKRVVRKTVWQNWYNSDGCIWAQKAFSTQEEANKVRLTGAGYIGTFPTEIEYEES